MRVNLTSYGRPGSKVYSLVARVPFTPVDLDIGRLARGEWDPMKDRCRVWFIPTIEKAGDRPLCNFTLRKFDQEAGVLLFMHLTVNLDASYREGSEPDHFYLGVLCNDDVRAKSALGCVLDTPPSFHRRKELSLVESRWRTDSALMYYLANVHSVMSSGPGTGGRMATLKVEGRASEDLMAMMKKGMGGWWKDEDEVSEAPSNPEASDSPARQEPNVP